MKCFKITFNDNKPVIINPKELEQAQVTFVYRRNSDNLLELNAWGFNSDDKKFDEYIWFKEEMGVSDSVVVECIDSESGDEPIEINELGPYVPECSFCHKTKDEVTCLIEAEYKAAYICNECVEVCLGVVKEYKEKENDT